MDFISLVTRAVKQGRNEMLCVYGRCESRVEMNLAGAEALKSYMAQLYGTVYTFGQTIMDPGSVGPVGSVGSIAGVPIFLMFDNRDDEPVARVLHAFPGGIAG